MAQQTRFARNASTNKTADAINARCSIETGCIGTIVNIDAAIGSGPTIHANARITANRIRTRRPILAERWSRQTFVNVILTKFTSEIRSTFAAVRIHTIDAFATILT